MAKRSEIRAATTLEIAVAEVHFLVDESPKDRAIGTTEEAVETARVLEQVAVPGADCPVALGGPELVEGITD